MSYITRRDKGDFVLSLDTCLVPCPNEPGYPWYVFNIGNTRLEQEDVDLACAYLGIPPGKEGRIVVLNTKFPVRDPHVHRASDPDPTGYCVALPDWKRPVLLDFGKQQLLADNYSPYDPEHPEVRVGRKQVGDEGPFGDFPWARKLIYFAAALKNLAKDIVSLKQDIRKMIEMAEGDAEILSVHVRCTENEVNVGVKLRHV